MAEGDGLEAGAEDSTRRGVIPPHIAQVALEGMSEAVVVADGEGHIVYANPAAAALVGGQAEDLAGYSLLGLATEPTAEPGPAPRSGPAEAGRLASGQLAAGIVRRADGTEVPIEMRLSDLGAPGGVPLSIASLRPRREQLDAERRSHLATRLLAVLSHEQREDEAVADLLATLGTVLEWDVTILWSFDRVDRVLRCRDAWRAADAFAGFEHQTRDRVVALGELLPGQVVATGAPAWVPDIAEEAGYLRKEAALAEGLRSAFAFPVRSGGEVIAVVELLSREHRELDPTLVHEMTSAGVQLGAYLSHVRAQQERERLVVDLEVARQTHVFLLRANQMLAGAANFQETLELLAAITVPAFGDICLIDVLAEDGTLRRMVARHADPARQPAVEELGRRYPPDRAGTHPAAEVIRSGRSMWSTDVTARFLRETTREEAHFQLVSALGARSYVSVPLAAGSRTLGALTLVLTGDHRRFTERDVDLVEELVRQVAAVVDSARVHEHEHEIAHVLQRSLLPERLPDIAGLSAHARYLPGSDAAEVGGDWFDVIPLAGGRAGLTVGDVEGHDLVAASVMGQLRNALRAYAVDGLEPGAVLGRLSGFCSSLGIERMATVVLSVVEPATGEVSIAAAGHLPPILVRRRGTPLLVPIEPGPPIGVGTFPYEERSFRLEVGDTLVFYTDGLVEDRQTGVEAGIEQLLEVVGQSPAEPAELCDTLERLADREGGRDDDVAVLAVQRTDEG